MADYDGRLFRLRMVPTTDTANTTVLVIPEFERLGHAEVSSLVAVALEGLQQNAHLFNLDKLNLCIFARESATTR